jgi:serpin B
LLQSGAIATSTRFVLTNTVYFNAGWETAFAPEQTAPGLFGKLDGSEASVPLLHASLTVPYAAGDAYQAVALPYADAAISFIAVLPNEGVYEGLEAKLDANWFDTLQSEWSTASVAVSLPKLDYKTHLSLKRAMQALGVNAAFSDADFPGLTRHPVAIDDVIQEAIIKVLEGGTIAAATTAVTFKDAGIALDDYTVSFDRPFVFAIVDQPTGEILFLGRVLDPSAH